MKTGGIIGVTQTEPHNNASSIVPVKKRVHWGENETRLFMPDQWRCASMLNEHAVAVQTARIKSLEPVARVDRPRVIPPPKVAESPTKKAIARHRWIGVLAPYVFIGSVLALAFGGPAGLALPLAFCAVAAAVVVLTREPTPKSWVTLEKQTTQKLRNKCQKKALIMRENGHIPQAYVYERLVKKLK